MLATEMQVKLTDGEQARMRCTTTSMSRPGPTGRGACPVSVDLRPGQSRGRECLVLALDRNSAPLNAMLASPIAWTPIGLEKNPFDIAMAKARRYAEGAEPDPCNADAHITSGMVLLMEGRHDEAVLDARKAGESTGSADVAQLAGFIVLPWVYGRGRRVCEKAIDSQPKLSRGLSGHAGDAYRQAGRTDDAIAAFKAYHARNPASVSPTS